MREPPVDESGQVSRRTFVIGVAGLATMGSAVAPVLAQAVAADADALTRAAGVAVIGVTPRALCLRGERWVLAGEDGSVTDTQGLDGATVLDLAAGPAGVFAAGSQPAGAATEAVIWRSADGVTWQEVVRQRGMNSEFTAVGTAGPAPAMALGSVLTEERAPKATIAARLESGSWSPVSVHGLEPTAEQPITTLSGNESGWLASSVGSNGTRLFRSAGGTNWGPHDGGIEDAAVQALLFESGGGVRWVGNALSGAATLAGRVGGERTSVPVPKEAHAVGAVWTTRGAVSYWLVDGRLVAAEI